MTCRTLNDNRAEDIAGQIVNPLKQEVLRRHFATGEKLKMIRLNTLHYRNLWLKQYRMNNPVFNANQKDHNALVQTFLKHDHEFAHA